MDFFGIGAAIRGAARIYIQSSRGTGRTTSLIESVKDGDRIVFALVTHAEHFKRLLKEMDASPKIECVVIDPRSPERIFERGSSQGRTIFDHSWVEQYYEIAIEQAMKDIANFERQSSGFGAVHRETRQALRERARWPL